MENWAGGLEKIKTGNTWPLGGMSSLPKKRQSLYIQETNDNDNGRNKNGIDRPETCLVDKKRSIIKLKCTDQMTFTDEQLPLMNEESIATIQNIRDSHNNLKSESSCKSIASDSKEFDSNVTNKPQKSCNNIKQSGNSAGLKQMENLANDQHTSDTKEHTENKSLPTVVDNSSQCTYTGTQDSLDHSSDNKSNYSERNIKSRARNLIVATLLLIVFVVIPLAVWSAFVYLQPSSDKPHASEILLTNVIQSAIFNINRTALQLHGPRSVNITWQNQNTSFLRAYGDTVVAKQNGTFHIVATINLDTSSISDAISSKRCDNARFRSLLCINMSRYSVDEANTCQRTNLPPYTAVPVTLGPVVVPLMKGDRIWISVLGINQVQRIGTKLVITQYLGGIG